MKVSHSSSLVLFKKARVDLALIKDKPNTLAKVQSSYSINLNTTQTASVKNKLTLKLLFNKLVNKVVPKKFRESAPKSEWKKIKSSKGGYHYVKMHASRDTAFAPHASKELYKWIRFSPVISGAELAKVRVTITPQNDNSRFSFHKYPRALTIWDVVKKRLRLFVNQYF